MIEGNVTMLDKVSTGWREFLVVASLAICVLIFALASDNGANYYPLVRFFVCVASAFLAFKAHRGGKANWVWIFGAIAVLYNPIVPVRLKRDVWSEVYGATIILLVVAIWLFCRNREKGQESVSLPLAPKQTKLSGSQILPGFFGFSATPKTGDKGSIYKVDMRECKCWGQTKVTQLAYFVENFSYFYSRQERRVEGYICFSCATYTFITFELRTLIGTWWGIIGMLLGPFYLLWNLFQYLTCSYRFAVYKWTSRHA